MGASVQLPPRENGRQHTPLAWSEGALALVVWPELGCDGSCPPLRAAPADTLATPGLEPGGGGWAAVAVWALPLRVFVASVGGPR